MQVTPPLREGAEPGTAVTAEACLLEVATTQKGGGEGAGASLSLGHDPNPNPEA